MKRVQLLFTAVALIVAAIGLAAAVPSNPGAVTYWSSDDLKAGKATGLPMTTSTHAYTLIRADGNRQAESHEGTIDILFVVSGRR